MDKKSGLALLGTDLSKRIYGLDILRTIAITLVVFHHTWIPFESTVLKYLFYHTPDGVSIFFVLSGYLIGRILINTLNQGDFKTKNMFHFWINRWLRTLPLYYLAFLVLLFLTRTFNLEIQSYYLSLTQKLSYLFFFQNFASPHHGFFAESWSLAVEEWFYLLVPVMLFIFINVFKITIHRAIILVIAIIMIFSLGYRFYVLYSFYSRDIEITTGIVMSSFKTVVLTRLDSIIIGVLGAYIASYHKEIWQRNSKFYFILGLIVMVVDQIINVFQNENILSYSGFWGVYTCIFSFPIFSIGVCLLLPYMVNIKTGKGYIYTFVTYISLVSYSLYMVNGSVNYCILFPIYETIPANIYLHIPLFWAIGIFLATLMYKFIEKPFMDSRKTILKKLNLDL